jgi:hypothetical protein
MTYRVLGFPNPGVQQVASQPAPFGYRFIADELADAGFVTSERRVCSDQAIWSVFAKKRGLSRKPDLRCTITSSTGTSPQMDPTDCG